MLHYPWSLNPEQGSMKSGCVLHSSSYCAWLVLLLQWPLLGFLSSDLKSHLQVKLVFFFAFYVRKHCILKRELKITSLSSSSVPKICALSLCCFFLCVYVCFSFVFPIWKSSLHVLSFGEKHSYFIETLGESWMDLKQTEKHWKIFRYAQSLI